MFIPRWNNALRAAKTQLISILYIKKCDSYPACLDPRGKRALEGGGDEESSKQDEA